MKVIDPATLALILADDFVDFDLYEFTLMNDGGVLRYCTANFAITDGTDTWVANSVRIVKAQTTGQAHWKTGLDVDTWNVSISPREPSNAGVFPDQINGVSWLEAVTNGALDGAELVVSRAYFQAPAPAWPIPPQGALLVGAPVVIFAGVVCEVDTTHITANMVVRDWRCILESQVPVHVYQAGCRHTLFDVACSLNADDFAQPGVVGAASTKATIRPMTLLPPAGSGTYKLGRVVMTSGNNNGMQRSVQDWDGITLTLVSPLPYEPEAGDGFVAYPGCNKSLASCDAFSNRINYGGQPAIPAAETAV